MAVKLRRDVYLDGSLRHSGEKEKKQFLPLNVFAKGQS